MISTDKSYMTVSIPGGSDTSTIIHFQATDTKNVYTQGESGYGDQSSGGSSSPPSEQATSANAESSTDKETAEPADKVLEEKLQDMTLNKTEQDTTTTTTTTEVAQTAGNPLLFTSDISFDNLF